MPRQKSLRSKAKSSPQPISLLDRFAKSSWLVAGTRLADLGGFVTAVIGALDWSPLLGVSGMSKNQVIITGVVVLLMGISHEAALRKNINA